jgi:sugar phosphate isomerase/epimerase
VHHPGDGDGLGADEGYAGVALTLDVQHLDPFADDALAQAEGVRRLCDTLGLGVVVETGARFLLDPRRKHQPTLVSTTAEGRAVRLRFLGRCCALADVLRAEAVSFWAGAPDAGVDRSTAWEWLRDGVRQLLDGQQDAAYALALEPEPGMLVADCDDWARLAAEVPGLTLALDTGHCVVEGRWLPQEAVRAFGPQLGTVAVEGMRRGVHEHLPLDEGDVDLPAVLAALDDVRWQGLVTLELSRDSHRAHEMVPRAMAYLRACEPV